MLSQAQTISSIYSSERIFKKNLLRIDKVIAISLVYYIFEDTVVNLQWNIIKKLPLLILTLSCHPHSF